MFSPFGEILSAKVLRDRETNRSRGFGFVEMANDSEAEAAVVALNDTDLEGRKIVVNVARPREERNDRNDRRPY